MQIFKDVHMRMYRAHGPGLFLEGSDKSIFNEQILYKII